MTEPHRLTREEARRIAVRAQLLDASRPVDLLDTVRRLTLVQYEPTAAVAPSADLDCGAGSDASNDPTICSEHWHPT